MNVRMKCFQVQSGLSLECLLLDTKHCCNFIRGLHDAGGERRAGKLQIGKKMHTCQRFRDARSTLTGKGSSQGLGTRATKLPSDIQGYYTLHGR